MAVPRRFGGIQIKTGAEAKVIRTFRIVRHLIASRTRVRRYQHQPEFGGGALCARLDHEGLFSTGQAGEVSDDRHRTRGGLRRLKHGKLHVAVVRRRRMTIKPDRAAEAGVFAQNFHGRLFPSVSC
jgi:hypothetical protein